MKKMIAFQTQMATVITAAIESTKGTKGKDPEAKKAELATTITAAALTLSLQYFATQQPEEPPATHVTQKDPALLTPNQYAYHTAHELLGPNAEQIRASNPALKDLSWTRLTSRVQETASLNWRQMCFETIPLQLESGLNTVQARDHLITYTTKSNPNSLRILDRSKPASTDTPTLFTQEIKFGEPVLSQHLTPTHLVVTTDTTIHLFSLPLEANPLCKEIKTTSQASNLTLSSTHLAYTTQDKLLIHPIDQMDQSIQLPIRSVQSLALSDQYVAIGCTEGEIFIAKLTKPELIQIPSTPKSPIKSIDIDKRALIIQQDKQVRLWDNPYALSAPCRVNPSHHGNHTHEIQQTHTVTLPAGDRLVLTLGDNLKVRTSELSSLYELPIHTQTTSQIIRTDPQGVFVINPILGSVAFLNFYCEHRGDQRPSMVTSLASKAASSAYDTLSGLWGGKPTAEGSLPE